MRYANLKAAWPPLNVWLWFFLLGGLWILLLLRLAQHRYEAQREPAVQVFQERMAGLRQAWQQDSTPVKVLVLGHSLVRAGIEPPDFFRQASDTQLAVYKVWVKGAGLDQFVDRYPFFEAAQLLAPDVLLIDEHLLSWQHQPEKRRFSDYLGTFSRQLRSSFLADRWQNGTRQDLRETADFNHFHPNQDQTAPATLTAPVVSRTVRSWAQDSLIRPQLQALQATGTLIFQLQLPRPQGHPLPEDPRFEQRTQQLAEALAIGYLPFEAPLPDSVFRDHAHLNTIGCRIFSDWLAATLLEIIEQ